MTFSTIRSVVLAIAGLIALIIGLAITLVPQAFYAGYGIVLTPQPDLMSEIRAPGANLAALGAVILAGAFYPSLAHTAALLGTIVFFAFASGRCVSLILDGLPSDSVLAALAIEVALGILCLLVARQWGRKERAKRTAHLVA